MNTTVNRPKKKKTLAITDPQFKEHDLIQVEQCIRIYLTQQTMRLQIQFNFFKHKHKIDNTFFFFFYYELKLNAYLACDGLVICPLSGIDYTDSI